jgi:flagellar basal body rod protein FlgF
MLVEMIAHARQFETQIKMMQLADTSDRSWSQLMNLSA